MAEPEGFCYSCGKAGLVVRASARGIPYLICKWCSTRIFCRGEGSAYRWLGRSLVDCQGDFSKTSEAVLEQARMVVQWAQGNLPDKRGKVVGTNAVDVGASL